MSNAVTVSSGGSCSTETVADNFNSVSYSQNDGSQNWSGSWQEVGESDGVSAGLARVRNDRCTSGNCLRLGVISGGSAQTYSNVGVSREADLTGASSATLTFNYRTGVQLGSETITLQASSNGGSSWTTLRTYTISSSNASATAESVDLSPYIASNTQIRFLASATNAVVGFYADDIELSYDDCVSTVTSTAEWRFDEQSWDTTADEIEDSSGNDRHGTSAFATSTASGQVCQAADLTDNGTSDYLLLDADALDGATDFSISTWVKTSNTGSQALVSGSSGSQHNELIMWFPNSSTFTPYLKGTSDGSISITSIADNQWHHLVWTREGSENCLYIDGSSQGCSTKTTSTLSIADGGLLVGQEQDSFAGGFSSGQDWEGLVDELVIFDGALSASEVSSIYSNQSAGNKSWDGTVRSCSGALVGEWRMDETTWSGVSDEVVDNSGNGNHAIAVNGATTLGTDPVVAGNPGTCRYGVFDDAG
ncbi:MAG: hypothetical protein OQK12_18570, partial [Motiliproteus sp.]|nr:hypothetical protein [Motiliproteus sp.]